MKTLLLIKTSLNVIKNHPFRAFLTVLGIMIGITAIIVVLSIGKGAETRIKSQILTLGENAVYIIPGNVVERGKVRSSFGRPARLTRTDLNALRNLDIVEHISRGHDVLGNYKYKDVDAKERIFGGDANIPNINDKEAEKGIFFNKNHVLKRANVIVLGSEMAKTLFKDEDPINKTIRINKKPFTVIGVLKYESNFWGTEDPNKRAYMPYTTAKKHFKKPEKTDEDLDFIALKIGKEKIKGEGLRRISRTLRHLHDIKPGAEDDFTIFDQQTISQSAESASRVIQLFGLIAASIALLVGGIGVMNIMLVSVQERTREIGIRLAIGATRSMIQTQFLIEAITLCLLGGLLGVLSGIGLLQILVHATSLPAHVEVIPMLLAFFITILVGIFFGYYPAYQASLLDPVEALYYK